MFVTAQAGTKLFHIGTNLFHIEVNLFHNRSDLFHIGENPKNSDEARGKARGDASRGFGGGAE